MFSNLLSNAAKFTPREGSVWVTLERSDSEALVKVRDSGIGIPPERLANIFEMFTQVHTPHGNDGLGIGLALVRQLVGLHGGTVRAFSEGVSKGSTFVVCLPLVEAEGGAVEHTGDPKTGNRPGLKILIVDDNADASESLAAVLRLEGHLVRTASSGAGALESADGERPDVVLMDLGMPGMDGLTAARLLRDRPEGEDIRIIALTGWGQESDRERTRAAGISEHLVKPVDPHFLIELLSQERT